MKLTVNPLVVAAALGLLGPAALMDDDQDDGVGISGLWKRSAAAHSPTPGRLGDEIQVLAIDGSVLLEDGSNAPQGTWNVEPDGPARQELCVDGTRVTRRFEADGDRLDVHTTVECPRGMVEYHETFVREA